MVYVESGGCLGLCPWQVERTHASTAGWISCDVQLCAKLKRINAVNCFCDCLLIDISDWRVKETRPHLTTSFNYGGHPRSVATRSHSGHLPQMRSEVERDPPKFFGSLGDKSPARIGSDQRLDFILQSVQLIGSESDRALSRSRPA